jgi:hypothetical protein
VAGHIRSRIPITDRQRRRSASDKKSGRNGAAYHDAIGHLMVGRRSSESGGTVDGGAGESRTRDTQFRKLLFGFIVGLLG